MADYISREAVINITAETGAWETQNRVRDLPAADVQPVKHGRWECVDRCSNYMDCDGNCFIDDTPCDCNGNIEKCKGR